jgi:quinohemoprotein amine dehydrogenase gamma subunit
MKHIKPLNKKARMFEKKEREQTGSKSADVSAMQSQPLGCSLVFDPGWETDGAGSVTGLCQPVESDLYGCYDDCWWPAQVPDQLTNYLEWSDKCAAAERDWRNLDVIFPEGK